MNQLNNLKDSCGAIAIKFCTQYNTKHVYCALGVFSLNIALCMLVKTVTDLCFKNHQNTTKPFAWRSLSLLITRATVVAASNVVFYRRFTLPINVYVFAGLAVIGFVIHCVNSYYDDKPKKKVDQNKTADTTVNMITTCFETEKKLLKSMQEQAKILNKNIDKQKKKIDNAIEACKKIVDAHTEIESDEHISDVN